MTKSRMEFAQNLAVKAGELGLQYFQHVETLTISNKGPQDLVSEADKNVETMVRTAIAESFPDDAIVGEEHGEAVGESGYTWVIDPIDGTSNFVTGLPEWCVIIACCKDGKTVIGVIHDPNTGETFSAERGQGAFVNGRQMRASQSNSTTKGAVGVSLNNRVDPETCLRFLSDLLHRGNGRFYRNASGGLMLAYVAAGRLIGYCEAHMNSWDCLAGMLMIEEAGGIVEPFDNAAAIHNGTRVVCGGPFVYGELKAMADAAFN